MKEFVDPAQAIRDVQHFGEEGGVVPVIDVASTSTFLNPSDMEKAFRGELAGCYLYSRHSNPTVSEFGQKLAAMEGMEAALGCASGMAAIAAAVEQLIPTGAHLVSSSLVYGGTYALFANLLPRRGVSVTFVSPDRLSEIEAAIRPETRAVYVEFLSNPLLTVTDLRGLGALCRRRGIKLIVDNTFTPAIVAPARYGADIVVYSCTKYLSGSGDMIAGAVVGSHDFVTSLVDLNHGVAMLTGPVMDSRVAHELSLRLDHLPLRMQAHSRAAAALADVMESEGVPVSYPGLESHPGHDLMKELANSSYGFGGMMTVHCGTAERAMRLASRLQAEKFGLYAVSLGFSRTLMSCPALTTSSEIPEPERERLGLSPGLLRLSIGLCGDAEILAGRFLKCWREVMA